jgi:hypothetical protein
MATSYTRTREQVRDMVLRKLRVLGVDRTASADEAEIIYEALDLRLKELHRLGVLWWKVSAAYTDVALTANVATATAPVDMLYPETVFIRYSDNDYPVSIIDHRAYQEIGTKSDKGRPEKVLIAAGTMRFYPVPDSNYTAKLTYQKIIDDSAASTAPDVPVQLMRWLKDLIAYDTGDDFRVPEPRMIRFEREAEKAERRIRALTPQVFETQSVQAEYF